MSVDAQTVRRIAHLARIAVSEEEARPTSDAVADALGVELPQPRHDDEDFAAKIAALQRDPVAFVSFTFGLPDRSVIEPLQAAGIAVGATVTSLDEARAAA